MSWCVKFDRISRSVVGLSAPLSGLKGLTLWSSENATLAKCCGSKATWKRSARLRSAPPPRPPVEIVPRWITRSEERRVGKECRSGWSADPEKKEGADKRRRCEVWERGRVLYSD